MNKILSFLRFAALLAAALILVFSYSVIERLKILKGKEAKADVSGSTSTSTSGSSTTSSNSGGGSGSGSGDDS